jgi:dUTP pyrophosphatase
MKIVLDEGATIPTQGSIGSAGYDLYASENTVVEARGRRKVRTGIHLQIPRGQAGIISHRSGMNGNYGIQAYGLIDSDYTGELLVTLFCHERYRDYKIQKGDRIAQITFVDVNNCSFEEVQELTDTNRGGNGHGSTGA